MSAEYNQNDIPHKGTIIYPEIEALRYVIAEQKEEIERLNDKIVDLDRDRAQAVNLANYFSDKLTEVLIRNKEGKFGFSFWDNDNEPKRTIQDNIDAGVYEDLSRAKDE